MNTETAIPPPCVTTTLSAERSLAANGCATPFQLKVNKRYAGANQLNVLAYVNFAGRNQQYLQLRDTCAEVATHFASVWVLNGNTMCCLQPNLKIPAWEGWMVIEESLANVDA